MLLDLLIFGVKTHTLNKKNRMNNNDEFEINELIEVFYNNDMFIGNIRKDNNKNLYYAEFDINKRNFKGNVFIYNKTIPKIRECLINTLKDIDGSKLDKINVKQINILNNSQYLN